MKRRSFVQQSALGAIGIGIGTPALAYNPFAFRYTHVIQWLRQMSWNLIITRRSQAHSSPSSFENITSEKNEHFAQLAFVKPDEHFYFFGDHDQFAFYPLVSTQQSSGSPDFIMPLFRQFETGEWQYVQTLNGFQVEAMVKASHALRKKEPSQLQHLIFPVGKMTGENSAGSYATHNGFVQVVTQLKRGRALSTYTIFDQSGKVHKDTFSCLHLMA